MLRSDIIDLPFLIQSVVLFPDENILIVPVSSSCNVKHESSFVDQILSLDLEVLVPDVLGLVPFQVSSSALVTDLH